jgi:anti-sigma factor ChrR (cupin superfamily)
MCATRQAAHAPFSREGCTLFVKLWQFAAGRRRTVCVDTARAPWRPGLVPGLSVLPLHEFDGVSTALVRWAPDTRFNTHSHPGGEEILVLQGLFRDEQGEYPAGTWLRSPRWSRHTPFTGSEGALIYVKVGHLGASSSSIVSGTSIQAAMARKDSPMIQRSRSGPSAWATQPPRAPAAAWLSSVATKMPATMGHGLRYRAASTMASNCVLSPISPSATMPVDTKKASKGISNGPTDKP